MITDKNIAKLSYENYDVTTTWETPHADVELEEIVNGFVTVLLGATWDYTTILNAMEEYVTKHKEL